MTSTKKSWLRTAGAGLALTLAAASNVWALDAVTTSPTKVYASVGGAFTFTVTLPPGNATSDTDLLVSYTANTGSPSITPYASCIDAATPSPYDGAPVNSKYVNWTAGLGVFPTAAACGAAAGAITLATFSGVATTIPGGAYTIQVLNGFANGDTNVTTNDVLVCGKTTVSSVTPGSDPTEGGTSSFTVNFAAVATGCGGFAIPVSLSGPAVAGKTAAITTNTCTNIADGATTCTVGISTAQNTTIDGNMLATLTVTDSTAASNYVSAGKSGSVNVLDDEVGASVAATTPAASETGPTSGVFTFTRTGATTAAQALTSTITGTALPATGNFSFAVGTCTAVSYAAPTLSLTVPSGSASCTVNVVPVDDSVVEGSQTVIAGVPTGPSAVGTGSAATVTIADNDTPPVFSVAKAGACAEAATPTNCSFSITRDSGVATATTVNFTVTGTATRATDYVLKTGGCAAGTTLTANTISHPDANALVIDVCPIDDLLVETGGETVIFTLTANPPTYTVGTAAQTQNIADDDSPQVVTVTGPAGTIAEAAGTGTFTFTRSGGSAAAQALALTVNIGRAGTATYGASCTAGVDYTSSATGTTVAFAASAPTTTVTVTACQDTVVDPAETIIYSVAAPTVATDYTVGSPASATGTIADDEVGVSVSGNGATEGSPVSFVLTCTGPAASTATVTFAINGQDAGATITPAQGAVTVTCGTPTTITVSTVDDATQGNNRSVGITLSNPVAPAVIVGSATASASVADNDAPKIVPTMSMLGLGFMSLMLAGFVAFQRRRVQK